MYALESLISRQIHRWNSIARALQQESVEEDTAAAAEPTDPRPAHPAITLSRDLGAGARTIATRLCERLNYTLIGREVIEALAADLKIQHQLVESLDEKAKSQLEIMIGSIMAGRATEREELNRSLARVMRTFGMKGGVVVLGRGSSFLLRDLAGLRVLVTAPEEVRLARVMASRSLSEAEALALLRSSERDRRAFIRQVFDADMHDPRNYDLCLNTASITPDDAVDLILLALERRGFPESRLRMPPG